MIIIPIGIDCIIADFLSKNNLRNKSYPFDWVLTYSGVHKIIDNNFIDYIPDDFSSGQILNTKYDVLFLHEKSPDDKLKYERRILRFKTLLENSKEEIIFLRRSHLLGHHEQHEYTNTSNDVEDSKKLNNILKSKYKNLKFKIILILMCNKCFSGKEYAGLTDIYPNIEIHNISSNNHDNNEFYKYMDTIINKFI
jgi:hypothetical protein